MGRNSNQVQFNQRSGRQHNSESSQVCRNQSDTAAKDAVKIPRERSIIFSGAMIKSILNGTKTQTRRVMDPKRLSVFKQFLFHWDKKAITCPYGKPGNLLWVRETWTYITTSWNESFDAIAPDPATPNGIPIKLLYRADGIEIPANWTPSIHMPRWASRLTLQIRDIRVEQVQDIHIDDIKAEGVFPGMRAAYENWKAASIRNDDYQYLKEFHWLWDSINAKRGYGWESNPWVWVIEFEKWPG